MSNYLDLRAKLQTKEHQEKQNAQLKQHRKAKLAALRQAPLSALANLPALPGSIRLPAGSNVMSTGGPQEGGSEGSPALGEGLQQPVGGTLGGAAGNSMRSTLRRTPYRSVLCPLGQNPQLAANGTPAAEEAASFGDSMSMSRRRGMNRSNRGQRPKSAGDKKEFSTKVHISQTLLGTGAFGAVYFATHTGTGQMIAVKKTNPVGNHRPKEAQEQLEQLASEIRLMEQLDHPNIVKYLHAERQDDQLLIYMELMSGSLAATAKKIGKVPEGLMRVYMSQVLEGLCYLHQRNVVHRDIKADNILLSTDGTAKISDFGTSREFNDSANLLTVTGTPWFMAPEVVKGSEGTGHGTPADIWSIGCTMVELVQGKPPWWQHSNPVTVMYQIGLHPEKIFDEISKDLSPELTELLIAAFQEDPSKRITARQMLDHSFFDEPEDGGGSSSSNDAGGDENKAETLAAAEVAGGETAELQQQRLALQELRRSGGNNLMPHPPGGVSSSSGGAASAASGAVPVPMALGRMGGGRRGSIGSRPGTPEIGTPRNYASKLRDETQGLQQ